MGDMIRWLIFAGIVAAAWFSSKQNHETARRIARFLPLASGLLLLSLAATGLLGVHLAPAELHHRLGHTLVIVVWLSVPFAIGVVLQQHLRPRPITAIGQSFALLLLLISVFFGAISGYLDPVGATPAEDELRRRFHFLHSCLLPGLSFLLLVEWWWFFSPDKLSGPRK